MKPGNGAALLGAALVVATAAVIAGISIAGTPAEGRRQRLDDVRARDLRGLVASIDAFWARHERLPASLRELASDTRSALAVTDPESGAEYEYRILGERSYELCAVFARSATPQRRAPEPFAVHDVGSSCFPLSTRTADP